MAVDFWILDFIQAHLRSAFMDLVMPIITLFGDGGIFWIVCTLILLIIPKTRRVGIVAAVSLALEALCCNVILKPWVARIRPYDVRTEIELLVAAPKDFSFPSGHTGASFAVVSGLFFGKAKNRLWMPAFVLTIFIAFSRLYLYVHYPTDVLAGMLIGIATGWIASLIVRAVEKRIEKNKSVNQI